MSNEVHFQTFPQTRSQAIALAWLNHQDLSDKTPTEVAKMFDAAQAEISKIKLPGAKAQTIHY